jgi:hypothetical protein
MIKKALLAAFLLMVQDDRIAVDWQASYGQL